MTIPTNNFVWRIAMSTFRDKKNKQIPAIRNFSLHPSDDFKLSVDWENYTSAEECMARVGASFKNGSTEYKNFNEKEIYAINTTYLGTLEEVIKTEHEPIDFNPCKKGIPNNPAHSLIHFNYGIQDEAEVYSKLRDHAKNNRVLHDLSITQKLVEEYKNKDCI